MSTKTFSPLMLAQQFPHFTRTIIYLQTFSSGAVTFGEKSSQGWRFTWGAVSFFLSCPKYSGLWFTFFSTVNNMSVVWKIWQRFLDFHHVLFAQTVSKVKLAICHWTLDLFFCMDWVRASWRYAGGTTSSLELHTWRSKCWARRRRHSCRSQPGLLSLSMWTWT